MRIEPSRKPTAGQVALVTGGTSGIGREVALQLARLGMDVLVVGRDATRGKEVEGQARGDGHRLEFYQADLGHQAQVRAVARHVLATRDRLDVLVHSQPMHGDRQRPP